jgi:uncharacterized protein
MRTIALEEHCLTPELRELVEADVDPYYIRQGSPPALEARLLDLGEGRLAAMDAQGIDMQVLSSGQPGLEHSSGERAVAVARAFNDRIAAAVAAHPDRFAGFAALPTAEPPASAAELTRAVQELGFVGALINGRTRERFLDDRYFWEIFEAAESLGVPIYLHPMPPPKAVYDAYYSGLGDQLGFMLSAPAWGWHIELGLHVLRLIVAGLFDRFPALQLIIGHMGEGLPFMLARSAGVLGGRPGHQAPRLALELSVPEYFKRNIWITTSGFFTDPPLQCALQTVGVERIMFAADHPYGDGAQARRWLEQAPISDEDRAKIAHGNAERLLSV